ncbi:DUF1553 domain-containing protein [Thalassoglobus sp.]|uniref:DUF1553 domain-containing protein n=1 Tax=Thalassoglobus sp. TaxID=2795869 RepID=UPI003AA8802A
MRELMSGKLLSQLALILLIVPANVQAEKLVNFETEIAPLLEKHCIRCHSPGNPKGELSLDSAEHLIRNNYLSAGEPDSSYLLDQISSSDGTRPAMPKEGEPLTKAEVNIFRQWILEGAKWPEDVIVREKSKADGSWWSLQPLSLSTPPMHEQAPEDWNTNPIDRFIFAKLKAKKLSPNPRATRRELIRRATFDLTGLPPTPEEVEHFLNDDSPEAYRKLIDRLLASPHYGERWGRHWLDVVRFGESNGFERNVLINDLWPFRDYVIQSINEDKPFDQFIREHLAGDVIGIGNPESEIGSAFLVAGPYDDVGNQDAEQAAQIRANTIDEMIRSSAEAFLGLTVGCARCHDHKFDPILQRDYYSWYATFSGVRHGRRVVATDQDKQEHQAKVQPLQQQQDSLTQQLAELNKNILQQGLSKLAEYEKKWTREPVNRLGSEETFEPVSVKFVRLVSEGQDSNFGNRNSFGIDEFEIWSNESTPRNVALASQGAKASGASRHIEDFPGAYGPHIAIDGKTGERFLATGGTLTIELPQPTTIQRIFFSSARDEPNPAQRKFAFVGEYRIESSLDGKEWKVIASSEDRKPLNMQHRDHRLRTLEETPEHRQKLAEFKRDLAKVNQQLAAIPPLPVIWVGQRVASDAEGPFHIFLGGSPQRPGEEVVPASLAVLSEGEANYELKPEASESERRESLANWIADNQNPLTSRVLANRIWHYHFGTGIVDTPSDFGYMGSQPTHPKLLDWLANQLIENNWQIKSIHRQIMLSQTYQQSSNYREDAARADGDARFLWRFPPRRLSAEEIRDTILQVSGQLNKKMGGPGFRLYHFMQDNVCTYDPLDKHGPETYRRAVYHQNARASVVDLMTEFDQPDCAFSISRRAETTTPLQALTMLNHNFTMDMSKALADRVINETSEDLDEQIKLIFSLCYNRSPSAEEVAASKEMIQQTSLAKYCRVILNTSEMIYVN